MGADTQSRRRVLATIATLAAGVASAGDHDGRRRKGRPSRPTRGRLAKAVFLSDHVGDAIAELASDGAGGVAR